MKDEIKEILDNLKYCKEHDKENNYYPEDIFSKDEPYKLLDYITNLQEENEIVHKDYVELSERYFFTKSRNEKAIEYVNENKHFELDCNKPFRKVSKYEEAYIKREKDLLNILENKND